MRGKAEAQHAAEDAAGDHPRLCGERAERTAKACVHLGSPPPMRGKAYQVRITLDLIGITPAYAGKSFLFWIPPTGR